MGVVRSSLDACHIPVYYMIKERNVIFHICFKLKYLEGAYLMLTSSVNLSTRCGAGLRGETPPPSSRRVDLLFRHAGRVELSMGIKK